MPTEKIYSISELTAMFDISSRTIRYYEEIGMLSSEHRESLTKQRFYTDKERRRLKLILRGKKLGFSLQEIREMIELYEFNPEGEDEKKRICELADRKLQEIEEQISELQNIKEEILTHKKKYIEKSGSNR